MSNHTLIRGGTIEVIGTDHCTFRTEQKAMGRGDFRRIPNGTGGLEERMSVLWHHGVRTGRLTPSEFVAATSTGMTVIGGAAITMSRGAILWENGRLPPREGHGRFVDRPCFGDAARSQAVRNIVARPMAVERQEFVP